MARGDYQTGAHKVYEGTQDNATATDGSIVERGDNGRVYRYIPKFDHTVIIQNGRSSAPLKGNQLPSQINASSNSMDTMIDEVLDRSGMTQKNIPTPEERPTDMGDDSASMNSTMTGTDNHPGKMKDDMVSASTGMADNTDGLSIGDILLGALGLGGAVAGGRALYSAYRNGYRPQSGGTNVQAGASAAEVPEGMTDAGVIDKQGRIGVEERKLLTGPSNAITDQSSQRALPSPTDESIAATLGDEDIDAVIRDRVEGASDDRPAEESRFTSKTSRLDPKIAQDVKLMADQGDLRGAVMLLRENGIELDDNMIRSLIESGPATSSLRARAQRMAGQAGRRAATQ